MVKPEHNQQTFLLQGHHALGTLFWVECFGLSVGSKREKELREGCVSILTSFEDRFSRFKEDSLISKLRRGEKVGVDEDLLRMYHFAERLSKESDGVFSIFIGNRITKKGYGKQTERFLFGEEQKIVQEEGSLVLSGEESLDLGGIGKGYVIDLLSAYLSKEGVPYHIINGGGDLYVTTNEKGLPVDIFLEHPLGDSSLVGSISLSHQGFASSSSFKRTWQKEGKQVNHFISKDGKEVWGAIYTTAHSCTVADTLATTILLSHDKEQREYVSSLYQTEYFLLTDSLSEKSELFPRIQEL